MIEATVLTKRYGDKTAVAGQFERAEALTRSFNDTELCGRTLAAIALAAVRANDLGRAERLVTRAQDRARHLRQHHGDVLALVGQALVELGHIDRAEGVVAAITIASERVEVLLAMARAATRWSSRRPMPRRGNAGRRRRP